MATLVQRLRLLEEMVCQSGSYSVHREAEVDGEALLLCNERNIDKVLPGLPAGPCLKLLNRLTDYLANCSYTTDEIFSSPGVSDGMDEVSAESDTENQPPHMPQNPSPVMPVRSPTISPSQSLPYSGEFPVEKLVFGPASQQAFRTGIVTREAKTDILNVVHNQILLLSCDKIYGDRHIRLYAAEALLRKYPQLKEGRSTQDGVNSWRNSLTTKGKNVRRALSSDDNPRLAMHREKYLTSKNSTTRNSDPDQSVTRRKRRAREMWALADEEVEEQTFKQQELKVEMLKAKRDRNDRLMAILHEATFPLRRKMIMEDSPHMSHILREWPTLRYSDLIIKDALLIAGIDRCSMKKLPSDVIVSYAELFVTKQVRSHPLNRVLYPHGREQDDEVITDSIGVATLPYFMPTRVKKTLVETHRLLIDLYPTDTPLMEIKDDVPGRNNPWILVRGTWSSVEKIQVVADGVLISQVETVSDAVHVLVSVHYIQDVEYHPQVKLAMKYLEQEVCGMPRVGREDYKDVVSFANMLKRN